MRRIIFLLNPNTLYFEKTFNRKTVEDFFYERNDIEIEFYIISQRGQVTDILIEETKKGVDTVVVVGGNGTLLETVQLMAYTNNKLGLISTGAGAAFARYSDYPEALDECLDAIMNNNVKHIDLGKVSDSKKSLYFLNYCCVGLTAKIVHNNFNKKRINTFFNYVLVAFRELIFFKPIEANFIIDPEEYNGNYHEIIFGNVSSYGGVRESNYLSQLTDGKLDVIAYRDFTKRKIFLYLLKMMFNVDEKFQKNAETYKFSKCQVELGNNPLVQVDWEKQFFNSNLTIECCPRSLKVLVPDNFEFV